MYRVATGGVSFRCPPTRSPRRGSSCRRTGRCPAMKKPTLKTFYEARCSEADLFAIAAIMVAVIAVGSIAIGRALTAKSVQIKVSSRSPEFVDRRCRHRSVRRRDSPPDRFACRGSDSRLRRAEPLPSAPAKHASLKRPRGTVAARSSMSHSLLFTWKGTDETAKPMLLMAHMDVVPVEPGTESSWTHGPFSGDVADGFVWGRGTLDDKVSVMAISGSGRDSLEPGFRTRADDPARLRPRRRDRRRMTVRPRSRRS